jgi:hypothetical protein
MRRGLLRAYGVADKLEGMWSVGAVIAAALSALMSFAASLGTHGLGMAIPAAAVAFAAILVSGGMLRGENRHALGPAITPTCKTDRKKNEKGEMTVHLKYPLKNYGTCTLRGMRIWIHSIDLDKPSSAGASCHETLMERQILHPGECFTYSANLNLTANEATEAMDGTYKALLLVRVFHREKPIYDMWSAWDSAFPNDLRMATDPEIEKVEIHLNAFLATKRATVPA